MPAGNVLIAFALVALAGLSTGIGSALAFFAKKTNTRFLAVSLGFSAGVMIYVSMMEIFPLSKEALVGVYGERLGYWIAVGAFFGGMALIALIDKLIPSAENPHEPHDVKEMTEPEEPALPKPDTVVIRHAHADFAPAESTPAHSVRSQRKLMRMGLLSALAIGIHNFPEGLATFTGALKDPTLGIAIAVAIAIHNIPEGIAVSVPVYYATGSRKKAFFYSFLSGVSEPVGALIGYFFLLQFFNDVMFGILFAAVGGIMVFISLDELLPTAEKYGEHHLCIYGVIGGMAVMALSLLLFV